MANWRKPTNLVKYIILVYGTPFSHVPASNSNVLIFILEQAVRIYYLCMLLYPYTRRYETVSRVCPRPSPSPSRSLLRPAYPSAIWRLFEANNYGEQPTRRGRRWRKWRAFCPFSTPQSISSSRLSINYSYYNWPTSSGNNDPIFSILTHSSTTRVPHTYNFDDQIYYSKMQILVGARSNCYSISTNAFTKSYLGGSVYSRTLFATAILI